MYITIREKTAVEAVLKQKIWYLSGIYLEQQSALIALAIFPFGVKCYISFCFYMFV